MDYILDNGYIDVGKIAQIGAVFNWILAPRGTGKTYGFLKYCIENDLKFILLRRTQAQIDTVANDQMTPFKTVCRDMGLFWNVTRVPKTSLYAVKFSREELSDMEWKQHATNAICLGLSTVSNIRGFDASEYTHIIYDEFCPEPHERPIRDECGAFLNAYETINRNRELNGEEPVRVFALGNANAIYNPYFIQLNHVSKVAEMQETGRICYYNPQQRYCILSFPCTEISREKSETALYTYAKRSQAFYNMAIENQFEYTSDDVCPAPLKEFEPYMAVGELLIFCHKSKSKLYCFMKRDGYKIDAKQFLSVYTSSEEDLKKFKILEGNTFKYYLYGLVLFESHEVKGLFLKYFT